MGEILINQLFAGAYLQEGTNIGHEVINLFRDDNDETIFILHLWEMSKDIMLIKYCLFKILRVEKRWKS